MRFAEKRVDKCSINHYYSYMHYRNGREAHNGDKVIQLDSFSGKIVSAGILHDATAGNDYCNGAIAPLNGNTGACLCDCLHVEDVQEVLKEKGWDKRPAGK
jgi:hypothetical protein